MRRLLLASLAGLLILLSACSDDHRKPVYDTASNPENFPQPAVNLIVDIENGSLNDYESIVDRFADLYTDHLDLVDNKAWQKIITNLGYRFKQRADSLATIGPSHYYRAGGLYALAAFAHPNDQAWLALKRQFDGWREMVDNNIIDSVFLVDSLSPTVEQKIALLRRFYLTDSTYARFADQRLIPILTNATGKLQTPGLSASDRVFLQYVGLLDGLPDSSLIKFSDPEISLVGLSVTQPQPNRYRIETYFISHEPISADYTVALRVEVPDSTLYTVKFDRNHYLPFDFYPLKESSTWQPGDLQAAVETIYLEHPLGEFLLGLYRSGSEPPSFLPITGSSQYLAPFPGSILLK